MTSAKGLESLDVAAGYWSTAGFVGEFGNVTVGEGASLQVNEVDLGEEGTSSPILTSMVRTDGLLVLNFGEDETVSALDDLTIDGRSEEHTSELQSIMRNSYAVFCLKKQH